MTRLLPRNQLAYAYAPRYCGYGECGKNEYGNPWFVATHALAEQMPLAPPFLGALAPRYFVARAWCQDRLSLQAVRSLSDLMKQLNAPAAGLVTLCGRPRWLA